MARGSKPTSEEWAVRSLWFLGGVIFKWLLDISFSTSNTDQQKHILNRNALRRHSYSTEELKLVLVVNDDLKMGKGKIGAQCGHAAVGVVEKLRSRGHAALLAHWEECGQPKICLKAKDELELRRLALEAKAANLPTFQVADAGRTQVAAGSHTVLAIGPGRKSDIDKVTGHLRLL